MTACYVLTFFTLNSGGLNIEQKRTKLLRCLKNTFKVHLKSVCYVPWYISHHLRAKPLNLSTLAWSHRVGGSTWIGRPGSSCLWVQFLRPMKKEQEIIAKLDIYCTKWQCTWTTTEDDMVHVQYTWQGIIDCYVP